MVKFPMLATALKFPARWWQVIRAAPHRHTYLLCAVVYFGSVLLVAAANPFALQALRLISFDSYQRIAPRSYDPELPVRVVAIDDASLRRFGQWPWPRTLIADLKIGRAHV